MRRVLTYFARFCDVGVSKAHGYARACPLKRVRSAEAFKHQLKAISKFGIGLDWCSDMYFFFSFLQCERVTNFGCHSPPEPDCSWGWVATVFFLLHTHKPCTSRFRCTCTPARTFILWWLQSSTTHAPFVVCNKKFVGAYELKIWTWLFDIPQCHMHALRTHISERFFHATLVFEVTARATKCFLKIHLFQRGSISAVEDWETCSFLVSVDLRVSRIRRHFHPLNLWLRWINNITVHTLDIRWCLIFDYSL